MGHVGQFVVRHRRAVLVFWFLVAIVGVAMVGNITSRLSSSETLPGLPSYAASQKILQIYGTGGDNAPVVMVLELPTGQSAETPTGRAEINTALTPLTNNKTLRVLSYNDTGDGRLLSDGGRSAAVLVFGNNNEPTSYTLGDAVRARAPAGMTVAATSYDDLANGSQSQGLGVLAETFVGAIGALIILAVVFGSLLALVPLVIAMVSIMGTFLLIGTVTTVAPVSVLVNYLIALIGLGIAIDYSLLVVTRWREERGRGLANHEAVAAAVATAGRTVAFSGVTVGTGLLALVVLPIPFLRSLGYAGILIPFVSVIVATTMLPALLATIGPRLDWPHRRGAPSAHPSGAWAAWARGVVRHRVLAGLFALVILGSLLGVASGIRVGAALPGALSSSGQAESGLATLEHDGFPVGMLNPVEVLVPSGESAGSIAHQLGGLAGTYTAVAPGGPTWERSGTALVDLVPVTATTAPGNTPLLDAIRSRLGAIAPRAEVTGSGFVEIDILHALYGRSVIILALVALITLVILTISFRSLVLSVKALLLNILSVGATMGLLVLVWQRGIGSHLLWGIPATGAVIDFIPLLVFPFLFGLSMDYEVFVVSRIREAHDAGQETDEAVVSGVAHTGRLVTSAALVLVLAFAALSAGPSVPLKMFATALAAGILLDATVVRALLLPAVVSLLGEKAWWYPARRTRAARAVSRSDDTELAGALK
jgi:putative drug exporter of the RND superfamily